MNLLSLVVGALADCPERATAQKISQEISLGEAAYQNMDETEFHRVYASIQELVPCVSTPFNAAQATTFWRLQALAAFLERDEEAAVIAFQSVLAISPGYVLSENIAPVGHPLQSWFDRAVETPATLDDVLNPPRSGRIFIDGSASISAPLSRPYLFQMTNEDGQLVISQVVQAGQRPPDYAAARESPISVPLAVTAGVSGAIAGGTWYLARARENTFWDPSTPTNDLEVLQRQANALGTVALSAGVVTLGTGAAAVFIGVW